MRTKIRPFILSMAIIAMATGLISCTDSDITDTQEPAHFNLSTEFLGDQRALTVGTDPEGAYYFVFETAGVDVPDQQWILSPIGNSFYKITNRSFGDSLSLDVINDGVFDRLTLAPTEDRSGQKWQITPLDNGYCRLTTEFLGPDLSLDVTSDTTTPMLTIRTSGSFSGQNWRLDQLDLGGNLDQLCMPDFS